MRVMNDKSRMTWSTIYITGKSDFRDEVRKKLEHGEQRYMPGYIENTSELDTHDLYWLDGRTDLRSFKEAIGAKLIWKYRLRFFASLEDFLAFENRDNGVEEFTDDELSKIAAMHALDEKLG